jgi:hypothetical protein
LIIYDFVKFKILWIKDSFHNILYNDN